MFMKRVLSSSVGFLLGAWAASAAAADLPRRAEMPTRAPAYMATVYNWTGLYLGLNGGGAWGNSRWDSPSGLSTGDFKVSGGLIGGTLGYNWQSGPAVFGLETDVAWSNIDGNTAANCLPNCKTSNNWLGTTRGRLGYGADRWMPFVTAGVAYGDVEAGFQGFNKESETKVGWTAGAGLEFALASNWTAKAEYLFVDLGKMSCGSGSCGFPAPTDVEFTANVVRGGVNVRF
jgi:outer membrane immunogenic protein